LAQIRDQAAIADLPTFRQLTKPCSALLNEAR
jgi:hypothetical protein